MSANKFARVKLTAILIVAIILGSMGVGLYLTGAAPTNAWIFNSKAVSLIDGGDGFSIGGDAQLTRSAANTWSLGAGDSLIGATWLNSTNLSAATEIYRAGVSLTTLLAAAGGSGGGVNVTEPRYIVSVDNSTGTPVYSAQDGITGAITTNADPQVLIQALITTCNGEGGGKIYVKEGTYNFTAAHNKLLIKSYVSLIGSGWGTLWKLPTNIANLDGFIINEHCRTSTPDIQMEIAGIRFDGRHALQSGTSSCSIYMEGAQHVKIHNCFFVDQVGWAIEFQDFSANSNHSSDVELAFNYCDYAGYNFCGFNVENNAGAWMNNINVHDNYVTNTDTAISFFGNVRSSSITNNICYLNNNELLFSNSIGIALEINGNGPTDCIVSNNICEANYGGILCTAGERISIVDNILYKNGVVGAYGVGVSIAADCHNFDVSHNKFYLYEDDESISLVINGTGHNISNNVFIGNTAGGMDVQYSADRSMFTGNIIRNPSSYAVCLYSADYNEFNYNYIYCTTTYGFPVFRVPLSGASTYNRFIGNHFYNLSGNAINIASGSNYNEIKLNNFENTATPISDAGTGTKIALNTGFVTENSGTITIASGTTTKSVTHGLSYTPSAQHLNITPTNATSAALNWYVTGIGATTFNITVTVAPSGAGAPFAWNNAKTP